MDNLDKKILCILEEDSRTPASRIAKQLRTNRNVVTYRINNLKKQGIIDKFITSINLGKLGYETYKIYFKISKINKSAELIDYLKKKKEIIHLTKLEGEYNLSCSIAVKNIVELDTFLTEIKTKFENIIKEIQVSIVVYSKIFKLKKILLGETTKTLKIEKYSHKETPISLDDIDKKILSCISQNANFSSIDIMDKTGLSLDVVKYRMKKLKNSIINSFRILLDLNKLGLFHYAILIKTNQMSKKWEEKLTSWATIKKNVLYCTKRIGTFDFEINVAITGINDLRNFINELESEFSEKIDSYSTILVSEILKLNYTPF